MYNSFEEQYQHPRWQKKRAEMMSLFNYKCQHCGCEDNQLHVHHRRYIKGRKIWEYELIELELLCNICHLNVHKLDDNIKKMLSNLSVYNKQILIGFMQVILNFNCETCDIEINDITMEGIAIAFGVPWQVVNDTFYKANKIIKEGGVVDIREYFKQETELYHNAPLM